MLAYLNRRNLLLASISAAILFYCSPMALLAYLLILLAMMTILHLGSANRAVKLANFLVNTATLLVTLLVLAVLLEIGLHLNPHFFIQNNAPDTLGEFSDFTTRGYLTAEVFKKQKGVFRILGLGDSFAVYAADQKKNYHDFLREKYTALGRGQVEIVNAGMPGVGPGYYWQILENWGDRFNPDLVLVGFFVGNDFEEWRMVISIGDFISEPKGLGQKIWDYRQFSNSRLAKVIRRKYLRYQEERRRTNEIREMKGDGVGTFSQETFLEIENKRSGIFDRKNRVALERQWRQCAGVISQMKRWCDERKLEMVLLVFPDQFQVDEDLRARVLEKYHIPAESLDLEYPNSLVSGYCRQNHLHCLDLLAPFQEQGKSRPLYVLRDSHWNEAGNRLAAEAIFKYLAEHNLIKAD